MSTERTPDRLLVELMDREAIRDCLYRYCRGIDRADEASLRASYWPDAHDRHGAYNGSASGFIDNALKVFARNPRMIHQVSNILIEFRGPTHAAVESYFSALQRSTGASGNTEQVMLAGRYCDLFEKRGDEWRVLERTVVYDWMEEQPVPDQSEPARFGPRKPIGAPYPDDAAYKIGSRDEA